MVALQVLVLSVEVRIPVLQLSVAREHFGQPEVLSFFADCRLCKCLGSPLSLIPILGNSFIGISRH